MQVILLENIINLGKVGDQVEVKDGFGRNYLLKFKKALRASKENIEYVKQKKNDLNKKNLEIKDQFKKIAEKIHNKTIKVHKETKENGELFANLKPKEISSLIENHFKVTINPSTVQLKKEINMLGNFDVEIKLHSEVTAKLTFAVTKIGSSSK